MAYSIYCFLVLFCFKLMAFDSLRGFVANTQTAAMNDSNAVWFNPASIAFLSGHEISFSYAYKNLSQNNLNHFNVTSAVGVTERVSFGLGFNAFGAGFFNNKTDFDSKLSIASSFGVQVNEKFGIGLSFFKLLEKNNDVLISFGSIVRPLRWLSMSTYYQELHNGYFNAPKLVAGFSVRPFKDYLTIGTDVNFIPNSTAWKNGFTVSPTFGLETRFAGFSLNFGMTPDKWGKNFSAQYTASIGFDFSNVGMTALSAYNSINKDYAYGGKLRLSTERWPSMATLKNYWVKLDIDSAGFLEEKSASSFFNTSLNDLQVLTYVRQLAEKENVEGIILTFLGFDFNLARAEEWKNIITYLRSKQKKVVVYLEYPSEYSCFFASAADYFFIAPDSTITFTAFKKNLFYLADALNLVGIEAQSTVSSSFKTYPRMWTDNKPQKEELIVAENILKNSYEKIVDQMSSSRNLEKENVKKVIDNGLVSAQDGKKYNLVDELVYKEDIDEEVKKLFGDDLYIHTHNYLINEKKVSWDLVKKIAVIPVIGEIVHGRVKTNFFNFLAEKEKTGSQDFIDTLDRVMLSEEVSAIVIYLDSPGGDAQASHDMYRALIRAKKLKPVVVSMGDKAASGAYMLSLASDYIYGLESTLTGSIGVFSLRFNAQNLLEKLKINVASLAKIKNPGGDLFKRNTKEEQEISQSIVDWNYDNFVSMVEKERNISKQEANINAQGRVWLGKEAYERKLITNLGGFTDAVKKACDISSGDHESYVKLVIYEPATGSIFDMQKYFLESKPTSFYDLIDEIMLKERIQARASIIP